MTSRKIKLVDKPTRSNFKPGGIVLQVVPCEFGGDDTPYRLDSDQVFVTIDRADIAVDPYENKLEIEC